MHLLRKRVNLMRKRRPDGLVQSATYHDVAIRVVQEAGVPQLFSIQPYFFVGSSLNDMLNFTMRLYSSLQSVCFVKQTILVSCIATYAVVSYVYRMHL